MGGLSQDQRGAFDLPFAHRCYFRSAGPVFCCVKARRRRKKARERERERERASSGRRRVSLFFNVGRKTQIKDSFIWRERQVYIVYGGRRARTRTQRGGWGAACFFRLVTCRARRQTGRRRRCCHRRRHPHHPRSILLQTRQVSTPLHPTSHARLTPLPPAAAASPAPPPTL